MRVTGESPVKAVLPFITLSCSATITVIQLSGQELQTSPHNGRVLMSHCKNMQTGILLLENAKTDRCTEKAELFQDWRSQESLPAVGDHSVSLPSSLSLCPPIHSSHCLLNYLKCKLDAIPMVGLTPSTCFQISRTYISIVTQNLLSITVAVSHM